MIHHPPMALAHDATSLLQRLIRLNTVNPPGNERPAQELLRGELEAAGFECELLGVSDERPNLDRAVARRSRTGRGSVTSATSTRCLPTPTSGRVDPWSGELRDGHVWGRGALDMKGQVACEVAAACALGAVGLAPRDGRAARDRDLRRGGRRDDRGAVALRAGAGEGPLRHGRERGRRGGGRVRGPPPLHVVRGREGGLPLQAHRPRAVPVTPRCRRWATTRCCA